MRKTKSETRCDALNRLRRAQDETDEQFAERMFICQMETYSAHAGRDLYGPEDFNRLPEDVRAMWINLARMTQEAQFAK